MSKLYICIGKKAKIPYSIPSEHLSVYTIEELCYYICDRAGTLDDNLMSEKLVDFIGTELALEQLAEVLLQMVRMEKPLHVFCETILEYADYPAADVRANVIQAIKESENLPVIRRLERQGDVYTKQKQYYLAQKAYRNMLLRDDVQRDPVLLAEIYAKLGNVAALMFQFETAAYCFDKSCGFEEKKQVRQKYLLCQRFMMSREQYLEWVATKEEYYDLSVDVERAYELANEQAKQQLWEENAADGIERLKEDFRRMVLE